MAADGVIETREYSKVLLTLDNVLIPSEKLSATPSIIDGLDIDTETDLRILGCELIQTSGILLRLPQVAMATGQVLFQRFYYSKSFVKHNMEVVAMACITLASKIEEAPRRIRDVISVFHHIKQVRAGKIITPLVLDTNYINLKNQVIKAERRALKELGFCCHVKHPHKLIVTYLQVLDANQNHRLVQCAWNYMNDSFRSDAFVRYNPETIACACIYLAARQLQMPLPNNPPWFAIFQVEEDDLKDICLCILRLYTRPKPNADKLEDIVNEVKKKHVEAKMKARGVGISASGTPNRTASHPGSPLMKIGSPVSNILPAAIKKLRSEDERSDGSQGGKRRKLSPDNDRHHSNSRSISKSPIRNHRPKAYRSPSSASASPEPVNRSRHSSPSHSYKAHKNSESRSSKHRKDRSKKHRSHLSPSDNTESRSRDRFDTKDSSRHSSKMHHHHHQPLQYQQRNNSSSSLTLGKRDRSRSRSNDRLKKRSNGHHNRENFHR